MYLDPHYLIDLGACIDFFFFQIYIHSAWISNSFFYLFILATLGLVAGCGVFTAAHRLSSCGL